MPEDPLTPPVGEVAPVTPAAPVTTPVAPVVPVVPVVPVTPPARDFEAELKASQAALISMSKDMENIQGTTAAHTVERNTLMGQIGQEIAKRETIEREQIEAAATAAATLATVSQATQTLSTENDTVKAELLAERAKNVKLSILTEEFPELLRYAQFIPASVDQAEVRGYCESLKAKRAEDHDQYRRVVGGAATMQTVPTGTPARIADTGDPAQLQIYLESAYNNPAEFEARIAASIENYESRRQR